MDLTPPFRGVAVTDGSRLGHWRELLEEWCLVHDRYCRVVPDNDSIFWNGERANVGALAAAAWRAGFVALEEYANPKKTAERSYRGRSDLWLGSSVSNDYVEAKFSWLLAVPNGFSVKAISQSLDTACQEVRSCRIQSGAARVGIVFCAVYVDKHQRENLNDLVRSSVEHVAVIQHDAIAWTFPTVAGKLTESDKDRYLRPGVIALARVANGPSNKRIEQTR